MRKVIDYVKENKKIFIVVVLIVILIGAVYVINKSKKPSYTATTSTMSATEVKLSGILSSIEGVGNTEVMVTENKDEILGVVIVCEGANNIMTRNNILNAVSTALGISKKIIAIYSLTV